MLRALLLAVAFLTAYVPTALVLPAVAVAQDGTAMILPIDPAPLVVETAQGEKTFSVEIADSDAERAAGLMFRRDMDDDHGMLFVFDRTRRLSFWMQNTPMPLDLVFIDENGRVGAVLPGEPFSTAPISPDGDMRFVLELKAGTAQKTGITDGVRLRHPEIEAVAGAG